MAMSFLSLCSLIVTVLFVHGEDSLYKGQTLVKGAYRSSNNGVFQLKMQDDGNLVLYCDGTKVIWASNTGGIAINRGLYFRSDGNLVIYGSNGKPVWASHTDHNAHKLIVQDDGNLVLYGNGTVHWESHTKSRCGRRRLNIRSCYFCDKKISTMFILMTHNSYALPTKVGSPNQNYGVGKQFRDGIRGFNFDIYRENGKIIMEHGPWHSSVDYSRTVAEIVREMNKWRYRDEFVLVQFEDYVGWNHIDQVVRPWGNKLITNFDPNKKLGYYINKGKRVLLTSKYRSQRTIAKGVHYYKDLITENQYKWTSALENVDFRHRRGPTNSDTSAKMMNHFCTAAGSGSMVSSAIVNRKSRMLYDARMFKKQSYAKNNINIIVVDYYDTGNIFDAQTSIRSGDFNSGCWNDGSLCGIGSTCFNCCSKHEYWYGKAFTACGKEPCWHDGRLCGIGTTCNRCCNRHNYWYGKAMTACGREPCWGRGTRCLKGTSCNRCCRGSSWHWRKFFTCCD